MIYLATGDYGVYSSRAVAWDVGAFFVSFSFTTTTEKIWAFKNLVFLLEMVGVIACLDYFFPLYFSLEHVIQSLFVLIQ